MNKMKAKRRRCRDCKHFIPPKFKNPDSYDIVKQAKCAKGKRVIFRLPKWVHDDDYGYIRYCDKFKKKKEQDD